MIHIDENITAIFNESIARRIANGSMGGAYVGPGWREIVEDLDRVLSKLDPNYVVNQIKEKFGSLRYYTGHPIKLEKGLQETFNNHIALAEELSSKTCEECGAPGKRYGIGKQFKLYKTVCDEHWHTVNNGLGKRNREDEFPTE